jgi:PAS domain S-box-containing protein
METISHLLNAGDSRADERIRVLSGAMRAFTDATPDAQGLVEIIARRVAQSLDACCAVLLLGSDGKALVPTGVFDVDPVALCQIRDQLAIAFARDAGPAVRQVLESGEPFYAPVLALEREFLPGIGIHSLLLVPLRDQGRAIGQLAVARLRQDSPAFTKQDLDFAQILAAQAALAIANGRLVAAERLRDERATATNQQRADLAAIVESSEEAIIGKTLQGVITSWNHGAEQIFGYSAAETVGRPLSLLIPAAYEEEEAAILSFLAKGEVRRLDTVRRRKDGRKIDVSVTISPVRDAQGRVVGISNVARDITERRQNEEALARAKDAAEAANSELEAFSYSVAHDLRAPLRGMNGFAQVLLDEYEDKFDEEGKDWLREILLNAQKMGALIDSLLSLSRVTRSEIKRESVDLSAVCRAAAAQLDAAEPQRTVEWVIEDGLRAACDPVLARALLENLLGNAWKFTAKVPVARIELGATEKEGAHAFYVRDNGAGFDMAFAKKLFAPFQRLHTVAEFPGTGIGLATVQRIVRRHGGQTWAEGAVDAGATFYFTLPSTTSEART